MKYRYPASVVDILVPLDRKILLIQRGKPPFKNYWALPGGFVNYGETLEHAAARELKEETSLIVKLKDLQLFGNYSKPTRDPRGHSIAHIYIASDYKGELMAGDDAGEAKWWNFDALPKLAFDHRRILTDYFREIGFLY